MLCARSFKQKLKIWFRT